MKKQGVGDATRRELNNAQNYTVHSVLDAAAMNLDNCKIYKPDRTT